MVESATDYAIFTTDPAGLVTSWNTGAERLLGYAESEILDRTADVIFPPEEGGAATAELERQQALATGRAEDDRWQMRKDGTRFWAGGLMMPLAEREAGFVKILRDRTQEHIAQTRLRESEERFRLLATNIPQLVFRSEPDGFRTWGSPQWIEFTGLSLGESVGLGWLDAVHPDDVAATRAAWDRARESGEYYVEHRVRRASDGAWRWHQTRARPIQEAQAAAAREWVGTMTDIHDLRGLHDRQQMLMAELQHRTRNLLAVMQAIAGQTLRSSGSLSEFGPQFEARLRALSRVQALLARVSHQAITMRELVLAELVAHGAQPGERVTVEGEPVGLTAEAAQALGLALHELATNAVKYGALSQPGGQLAVSWRVDRGEEGEGVTLEWRETGVAYPGATPPTNRGYGSQLIGRALPYQLNASTSLVFGPEGVECRISVPLDATTPDPPDDDAMPAGS
jgi:PAS domain S-box-containing protein